MAHFPLLPRKKNTDKSHYGHALILGGSRGMAGAPVLAARAALAAGAGLATLGTPSDLQAFIARRAIPEVMTLGLGSGTSFKLSDVRAVLAFAEKRRVNAIVLGPGISLLPGAQKFARQIVRRSKAPVVLDADGLNAFRGRARELNKAPAPLILTPHAGEFARIFGKNLPEDTAARVRLGKALAKEYGVTLVLKGHRSVVAGGGQCAVNRTGNPGMAKGGSGDVLSGIIGAFLAQGLTPFEAAKWAAYFHGRAGDLAVRKKGRLGMLASDLIDYLPKAFSK